MKNTQREKEREKVYDILTAFGPDVDIARVGKLLPSVRKRVGDITKSSRQRIEKALDDMGMFGPSSDKLRNSGDRYY